MKMITKLFGRISTLFFQPRLTPLLFQPPPIINNYYNVQPPLPFYSNPSYYSGLESICLDPFKNHTSKILLS